MLLNSPRPQQFPVTKSQKDASLVSDGTLRQYTLSSQGLFADYLKGDGPTKAGLATGN
ncbi:MAG: hypothetical protein NTX57_18685 [Armatimonadetes bacterium]|nr:hypothetical protein [Armatimonadota bacterium]